MISTPPACEAIDPDGNVIREGMMIVCCREVWIVSRIDIHRGRLVWIVADRTDSAGKKSRLLVGRARLRSIAIIGFQAPKTTYP